MISSYYLRRSLGPFSTSVGREIAIKYIFLQFHTIYHNDSSLLNSRTNSHNDPVRIRCVLFTTTKHSLTLYNNYPINHLHRLSGSTYRCSLNTESLNYPSDRASRAQAQIRLRRVCISDNPVLARVVHYATNERPLE